MIDVVAAFGRAARELARPDVLWQALWPPLAAIAMWAVIGVLVWARGIATIGQLLPQLPWSGWEWIASWAAGFLLLAAFAALAYATALLLVAVVVLPRLVDMVARRDYPDLARHGENAFRGSLGNTLIATAVFVAGGLASLPLLLIPGAVLVLPLAWSAWLNQRTFRFDALAEHATRAELGAIFAREQTGFHLAGAGTALISLAPLLNLLAPAFTALVFVHLGLGALRRQRQLNGIQL